jgi:hypothetical protein
MIQCSQHKEIPMKQFEKTVAITFRWWRENKKDIDPKNTQFLTEEAKENIEWMRKGGFTSGELFAENNGVEYTGWWEEKDITED